MIDAKCIGVGQPEHAAARIDARQPLGRVLCGWEGGTLNAHAADESVAVSSLELQSTCV